MPDPGKKRNPRKGEGLAKKNFRSGGLLDVFIEVGRQLQHIDRAVPDHFAELLVWTNHSSILGILQLMAFDVDPDFLDDLGAGHFFRAADRLQFRGHRIGQRGETRFSFAA